LQQNFADPGRFFSKRAAGSLTAYVGVKREEKPDIANKGKVPEERLRISLSRT
jgi:hypothetical protein